MNRIDRLTAILIHLQSKRVVKAEEMAERFEISLRTVYRDVKALMEAGVPIGSEAGKGYFIVDGFHLPPVMFTQEEASAMLVASKLVERMTDKSIQKTFESALMKIKAVLNDNEKDHLENLQTYIQVFRGSPMSQKEEFPDNFMTDIQKAIVNKHVLRIDYSSNNQGELTDREIEPIGLFYYSFAWHLIAWCRLRNGYRDFRTDRIINLKNTSCTFDDRSRFTLQEYLESLKHSNRDMHEVKLLFDKPVTGYMSHAKHYYGLVSEEDLGDKVRMNFLVGNLRYFCRGILMQGNTVEIEYPEEAKAIAQELVEELYAHYLKVAA
ncbi:helix-turn-helix transcriptional regulator, partial [Ohtaekwangia sp.]